MCSWCRGHGLGYCMWEYWSGDINSLEWLSVSSSTCLKMAVKLRHCKESSTGNEAIAEVVS